MGNAFEALGIFNKRLEFYPCKISTYNQLEITNIILGNEQLVKSNIDTALEIDPANSRAQENLRYEYNLE